MKKIAIAISLVAVLLNVTAQDTTAVNRSDLGVVKIIDDEAGTNITIGDDLLVVENNSEIIKIKLGKNGISILDPEGKPKLKFERYDETAPELFNREEDDKESKRKNRRRFTPHWSGFGLGMNSYVTADNSTSLPAAYNYMDLNSGKSIAFHLNFGQLGLGLTRHIGLVTGLGLESNNYVFDGNNNIEKDAQGVVGEWTPAPGIALDKSKLTVNYLVVPVLLEIQLPVNGHNTLNLAGGVIGGLKIGSHSKVVYHDDGKQKVKDKSDFSLNEIRYGPTIRVGYESFQIFGTYYMNGLFKETKGPELYPVEIGVAFSFD